ncbi:hypothetical protein RXV95_15770 [Novosphingobium sp. ZN18A2]|uniref:hypothetical protein n=1 Tax=Novosphingobium sp. ZN18A2 TaxID=3079861 RepID=UPI0030CC33E6
MRIPALLAAASLVLPLPAAAQQAAPPPPDLSKLTLEHRAALKCAAVFAIVASEQQRGVESALEWPPLGWRGKEYFVRTSARVIDEAGLTKEQVRDLLVADVAAFQKQAVDSHDPDGTVKAAMKPCLTLLDAAIPPLQTPDLLTCSAILQLAYDEVHTREGLSASAKDLKTLALVLKDRARKQLIAGGKSGNEADRAIEQAHDRVVGEDADKSKGGANRYDINVCFDLAKPDKAKHY